MDLPSGTITFLFTDIEGSTALLTRLHEDAYAELLAVHHSILRKALAQHDGREMDTQGDALFAVFARAVDAVAFADEAQRALADYSAKTGINVRVRMGLHTGEAIVTPTGYVGIDVHRAARICAIGHGGQVLLSESARALVQNELPDGIMLRDLGSHRLKDLQAAERIYQLVSAGLPTDFPPLTSLDGIANNLPIQLTNFVGREREIKELKEYLAPVSKDKAQGVRLLTLTGTGGTGKTRLALQVAADLLDQFPDGVWFVELAPLADPALISASIAAVLGVREQTGRRHLDTLADYIRSKKMLLLLDNCEHLIDAAAQVCETLLHAAPGLVILATSREALGIAGELSYRVPSLSLPRATKAERPDVDSAASAFSLAGLVQAESVQLFLARAKAVQPHFEMTALNAPAIAQIVGRLDGIPLAIELAAARVKLFSPEQIAARLDDHFRLLTGGSRTALPRQQTLRALIDWSYDLLSEQERVLLRRLSVFSGGWTFEAAEAITQDETDSAFVDLLAHLVDKSLVLVEDQGAGEMRYRLLEMIRQYGRDKLREAGEAEATRNRHLDYYLALVSQQLGVVGQPIELATFRLISRENDNLRAALAWGVESQPLKAFEMASRLSPYWMRTALMAEGREWLDATFTRAENIAPQATRARSRVALGNLLLGQGLSMQARAAFEAGVEMYRSLGDAVGLGMGLDLLALVDLFLGNIEQAPAEADEAIKVARASGDRLGLVMALSTRGYIASIAEQNNEIAMNCLKEGIALGRASGKPWYVGMPLMQFGRAAFQQGDYDQSRRALTEAMDIFRGQEDLFFCNVARAQLAEAVRRQGDLDTAIELYHETIDNWHRYGQQGGLARCLECLGYISARQAGDAPGETRRVMLGRAAELLGAAEAVRQSFGLVMMLDERAEHDREVAALRAQMDESAFAAAWAQGSALSVDAAMSLSKTMGATWDKPSPVR